MNVSLRASTHPRRAMVLLVVLVVIALLSLAGYSFSELMLAEYQAAQVSGRKLQAHALADSGLEMLKTFLAQETTIINEQGGLFDNPETMQGRIVVEDENPRGRGRFTILAPQLDENGILNGVRFGVENESTRLNLNTLLLAEQYQENGGRTLLLSLPGMTEEIADAILDWMDADDDIREYGAEIEFYTGLEPPYAPKNGPLESVEELLLVRGVTPELLFGPDANRNGMVDSYEPDGTTVGDFDNSMGTMNRGWSAYLTLYSAESNLNPDGEAKIDLNGEDMQVLFDALSARFEPSWATYIVAYRQNGPYTGSESGEAGATGELDLSRPGRIPLTSVLDMVGTKVQVRFQGDRNSTVLESPFPNVPLAMNVYLPPLLDQAAVNTAAVIPGRININQAPRVILLGVPGMTEEIADEILSRREYEVDENQNQRRHESWLMSEGIVTLAEMKVMFPFITTGGNVYRAQVVGYYDEGGPAARIETVIDTNGPLPRVVFWRDLSHLGRGYALETLGLADTSEN